MALRFLVVEGNTREGRARYAAGAGRTPSQAYAGVLRELEPTALCDIAYPADEGAESELPGSLASYDAVVLTGSALHAYDHEPAVTRQVDLMRAVYAADVPAFGSCWGLQIGAVAAGGEVRRNPLGREVGFARNVTPTGAGQAHPLLAGRPAVFTCPAVHLDAVMTPPPDCTVLARNGNSAMQAAEIRHAGGTFWGVQYHPEFDLLELASILSRIADQLVAEGFCATGEDAAAYVQDLEALHADPGRADLAWRHGLDCEVLDPTRRRAEIRNFIHHHVKPHRSRTGRA